MKNKNIILGISTSHDSGASLIINNELVYAVSEERLSRKKMHIGFPFKSISLILKEFNLNPTDISSIGIAGKINLGEMPLRNDMLMDNNSKKFLQILFEFFDSIPILSKLINSKLIVSLYRKISPALSKRLTPTLMNLKQLGFKCPVLFFDHHVCHAASAYYFFGEKDSLVITNDGFGDGLCSIVTNFNNHEPNIINQNPFKNSLGVYYGFATKICGFKYIHHAGKTTGLAAFGNPDETYQILTQYINWDINSANYINLKYNFSRTLKNLETDLSSFSREDVAAGIQKLTEDILVKYINYYLDKYPHKNLLLAGGVHANVKANQRIYASISDKIDNFFVFPAMSDVGLSSGSAWLAAAKQMKKNYLPKRSNHVFLGPQYNEDFILDCLKTNQKLTFFKSSNVEREVAHYLGDDKVVARFTGRMEYGPRALCHRSILYNAKDKSVNTWLNKQLKRTEFMPFAPVMRDVDASKYLNKFDINNSFTSQFMTLTYDVKDRFLNEAPAAVHIDNTVRPQIVFKNDDVNSSIYRILNEYKKLTNLSILVNTSFNMHEEPIVCSPDHAIRAFLLSNIDVLAIEDFICMRR